MGQNRDLVAVVVGDGSFIGTKWEEQDGGGPGNLGVGAPTGLAGQ